MSQAAPGRRTGKAMLWVVWLLGLFLAVRFFAAWEDRQTHPNQEVRSVHGDGYIEVLLQGNVQGHYLVDGRINGQPVTFLLDTGATDVALSQGLAEALDLEQGPAILLQTANGQATGYRTRIATLQFGDIQLRNVRALIAPGMDDDQVLLGMSALKQLEFTQRGGNLLLRQYPSE